MSQTAFHLRNSLTSQSARERMCLALLPVIGPYTDERPRRPGGGPDGGRDLEALYRGSMEVWGAVGFRNGGGLDAASRREMGKKFQRDLDRALSENPALQGFVFFTNVDLDLSIIKRMKKYGSSKGLQLVDICDFERLCHALDSPEGLIARLQYLDIEMSKTEQAALVDRFGTQLQSAIHSRFDRVDRTLAKMEHFLELQKPIGRIDAYLALSRPLTSAVIGRQAFLISIENLSPVHKDLKILCLNQASHPNASSQIISTARVWSHGNTPITFPNFVSPSALVMSCFCQLSLNALYLRVRIADITSLRLTVAVTSELRCLAHGIAVDFNGLEMFNVPLAGNQPIRDLELPVEVWRHVRPRWNLAVDSYCREFFLDSPKLSKRYRKLLPQPDSTAAVE